MSDKRYKAYVHGVPGLHGAGKFYFQHMPAKDKDPEWHETIQEALTKSRELLRKKMTTWAGPPKNP